MVAKRLFPKEAETDIKTNGLYLQEIKKRREQVRSAKANYNRNLIHENIDDSKSLWRAVERILPNDKKLKQSVSAIKIHGNPKTDKNAIAECFNHFFASIFKTISDKLSQRSSGSHLCKILKLLLQTKPSSLV